ncbi:MAG: MBL fold metallo-hydrolase [Candidatus Hodarchaeota archaeon]
MVNIRFLGNACIEIIGTQDHIIIDPVFLTTPRKGIEKIIITHHHPDHVTQEKLSEILNNYWNENKEPEIYGPLCVYQELSIDFTLIQPNSRINLNDGFVTVFENKCWKAEGCVAYLTTIEDKKILHTADSAQFSDELKSIKDKIDLCFVACFESNFNDYLEFLNKISPKLAIPYHFNKEKEGDAKTLNKFLSDNNIKSSFLSIGEEFGL